MSTIILTDDPSRTRVSTFSDDSYQPYTQNAPVVVARIPISDLRWHKDVVERLARRGGEVKASRVLRHWDGLPHDLRRAIKTTIREARISILDPRSYAFEFDGMLSRAARGLGSDVRQRIRKQFLFKYVRDRVLIDSPAFRIQQMLFPDPMLDLSEVYGVSSADIRNDSLFKELRKKLQKPHTVHLFGARSTVAFAEILDPEEQANALRKMQEGGFFARDSVDASIFRKHRATRHVFDEGNSATVGAIEFLRQTAETAVKRLDRFPLMLEGEGEIIEKPSTYSPELQAADLAAGYARQLYESHDGLKKVCLEFRQVLLNGTVVSEWRQEGYIETALR